MNIKLIGFSEVLQVDCEGKWEKLKMISWFFLVWATGSLTEENKKFDIGHINFDIPFTHPYEGLTRQLYKSGNHHGRVGDIK